MKKLRTDWKKYIEGIRQREIDLIIPYIQNKKYKVGIEIGQVMDSKAASYQNT